MKQAPCSTQIPCTCKNRDSKLLGKLGSQGESLCVFWVGGAGGTPTNLPKTQREPVPG